MKIDFTKKEYQRLVDLLMIADWILHAFDPDEDPETKQYKEVIQKIYTHAPDMKCDDIVAYDDELKGFCPTPEYEEESGVMDFLEEYEENLFWFGLAHRLAVKTILEEEGGESFQNLSEHEQAAKIIPLETRFAEELFENGLTNVTAKLGPPEA